MSPRKPSKAPRLRRLAAVLVCFVLLAGGAWLALEHWVLQIDRFRPQVVDAIEKATGLSAYIGELDLVLFPTLHLNAHDLSIGEGAFNAGAQRVTMHIRLLPLLRKHLSVTSAEIVALKARIPRNASVLIGHIESIQERIEANGGNDSSFTVDIASIRADSATLYWEDSEEEIAAFDLNVSDVLGDSFLLTATGSLPRLGEEARIECEFAIARADGAFDSAKGQALIQNIDTTQAPVNGMPKANVTIAIDALMDSPESILLNIEGDVRSSAHPALTGPIRAEASWRDGTFTIDETTWEGTGVTAKVTAGITDDGFLRVDSFSAKLSKDGIEAFVPILTGERVRLVALDDAFVHATDIRLTWKPDEKLALSGGSLHFSGVELALDDGEHVTNGLHGRFAFADDTIHVEELGDEAFTLNGTLSPDMPARSLQVDLTGSGNLQREHVEALLDWDEIAEAEATVVIDRLAGTFIVGQGMPEDLIVTGSIRNGRVVVEHEDYADTITPITASFYCDAQGIRTTLELSSERSGSMQVVGEYAYGTHEWRGTMDVDVLQLVARLLDRDPEDLFYAPVLALYSPSALATTIKVPYRERKALKIEVQREGKAALRGIAEFDSDPDGSLVLARINAVAPFTLDEVETRLFERAQVSGEAELRFDYDSSTERFETTLDLTETEIRAGRSLAKRRGDSLRFTTSSVAGSGWQHNRLQIDLLGETVTLGLGPNLGTYSPIDIDLASLSRLAPEGGSAHGRIRGEVRLEPLEVSLSLDDVALSLAEGVSIDSMTGGIRFSDNSISVENMRLAGANSDCTVQGSWSHSRWEGEARGKSLDLDAFLELIDAIRSFETIDIIEEPTSQSFLEELKSGTFVIALDRVQLRRGHFDDVRARVQVEGKRIRVRDIHARPYSGSITGTIDIVSVENARPLVTARFALDSIDAKSVDDLLFEEPRQIYGTISGDLDIRAPLGNIHEMLAGANGIVHWKATDGSWGKMGFASKLLTALKPVEIINLRAPSLRNKGLVYDSFIGSAVFEEGTMTLSKVFLDGGAYAMDVRGGIDFPTEETDIRVHTRVLNSVAKTVKWIPLVRQVVKMGTNQVGVAVRMSGSPYDMQAKIVVGGGVVGTAVGLGGQAVKKGTNAVKKLIPGVGKNKPPQKVEPEPSH